MPTVTIDTVDYPAFQDVDGADAFLAADLVRAAPWALRSTDAKGQGLVTATRILLTLPWCGDAPTTDDPPVPLPDVTAMFAADLLTKPKLAANPSGAQPRGIKTAGAGSAKVEFFGPAAALIAGPPTPIPAPLWDMLVAAGLVGCTDGGSADDGPFVSGISDGCGYAPGAYDRRLGQDRDYVDSLGRGY